MQAAMRPLRTGLSINTLSAGDDAERQVDVAAISR
jgi:hypothetical protein